MNTSTWQSRLDITGKMGLFPLLGPEMGPGKKIEKKSLLPTLLDGHFSCYFSRRGLSLLKPSIHTYLVLTMAWNSLCRLSMLHFSMQEGARISHSTSPSAFHSTGPESVPLEVRLQSIFGNVFALEIKRNEIKY